jgi:hypothetical protein
MLTPHVTPMSALPSAHAYEQEHTVPGYYRHKRGEGGTTDIFTWVARTDSLMGDSDAPAKYFSAEPGAD